METYKHSEKWGELDYIQVYNEIFVSKIYTKYFDIEDGDVVVDMGSNIGLFTLFTLLNYDVEKIYSIEPLPENYIYIVENILDTQKSDKVITSCCAVGKKEDSFITPHGISSFISNNENEDSIKIKTHTFMEFIEFFNIDRIDFLKMDIEGSEVHIFNEDSYYFFKNKVKKMVIELHANVTGVNINETLSKLAKKIGKLGFKVILTSLDGIDITYNIYENRKLEDVGGHYSWDYYSEYLLYAEKL